VDLDADGVSRAVREVLRVARVDDDRAAGVVDLEAA
jgi:hypothetical protein